MAVRAKFYIGSVTQRAGARMSGYAEPVPQGDVIMYPAARGEANKEWASATPSGEFKMTVRGSALPWFAENLGREVNILIDLADEEPAG